MFERLDPRSPTPLYEQIAARIRVGIAAGDLDPGDTLPSVRHLAATLRVNPATVVQAYRVLEAEGFVERRHGAGTFIRAIGQDRRDGERERQIEAWAERVLAEGARLGIGIDELAPALERAREKGRHG